MYEAIRELSQALNGVDILWGVGGSLMLQTYGIINEVHDIDFIIAKCDIDKAIKVMNQIAIIKEAPIQKEYHTEHFYTYRLNGINIDVMSSFKISHSCGIYEFILDEASITKHLDYQEL